MNVHPSSRLLSPVAFLSSFLTRRITGFLLSVILLLTLLSTSALGNDFKSQRRYIEGSVLWQINGLSHLENVEQRDQNRNFLRGLSVIASRSDGSGGTIEIEMNNTLDETKNISFWHEGLDADGPWAFSIKPLDDTFDYGVVMVTKHAGDSNGIDVSNIETRLSSNKFYVHLIVTRGPVSGRVTSGGQGIPGVEVVESSVGRTTTTDMNGYYVLENLLTADEPVVSISKGTGEREYEFRSGFFSKPVVSSGVVAAGKSIINFTVAKAPIEGLTFIGGNPLPDVAVRLENASRELVETTTSDASGQFIFSKVSASGSYFVVPQLEGYTFNPSKENDVIAGQGPEITFANAQRELKFGATKGRIRGHITSGSTEISGIRVEIYKGGQFQEFTTTDQDGNYQTTDLPANTPGDASALELYTVKPVAAGVTFDPQFVEMVTAGTSGIDFAAKYALSGEVRTIAASTGGEKAPISGVAISLFSDAARTMQLASTSTDGAGYYELPPLTVGTYYLSASDSRYLFRKNDTTEVQPLDLAVVITHDTVPNTRNFTAYSQIEGRTTFAGQSVGGVTVSVSIGAILSPGQTLDWTPDAGVFGNAIPAFSVVAIDQDLAISSPPVQVTINVSQAPPSLSIRSIDATLAEGDAGQTPFLFEVAREGDTSGETTVGFTVTGKAPNPAEPADFAGGAFPTGTLTFPPSSISQSLTILIEGDLQPEFTEQFEVLLSSPSGSAIIVQATATGIIIEDDTPGATIIIADRGPPVFNGAIHRLGTVPPNQFPITTELVDPYDVALDHAGNYIVIDYETIRSSKGRGTQGLYRVAPSTMSVQLLSTGGDFVVPIGVVVEEDGRILVLDQDAYNLSGAVFRIDPSGPLPTGQTTLARGGVPGAHLFYPVGIGVSPPGAPNEGDIFVCDIGNSLGQTSKRDNPPRKIIRIDPVSGSQSVVLEDRLSSPDSQLSYPVGIDVDRRTGNLFVADAYTRKVVEITPTGELSVVANDPRFIQPTHLAVDQETGHLYVSDAISRAGIGQRRVYRIDPNAPPEFNTTIVALDGFLEEPRGLTIVP